VSNRTDPAPAPPAPGPSWTEFAERERVDVSTARQWRKDGTGPAYLPITESATKATIRYRLADIEAWEQSRLRVPAPA
jgi:hypothetical protein